MGGGGFEGRGVWGEEGTRGGGVEGKVGGVAVVVSRNARGNVGEHPGRWLGGRGVERLGVPVLWQLLRTRVLTPAPAHAALTWALTRGSLFFLIFLRSAPAASAVVPCGLGSEAAVAEAAMRR